MMLQKNVEREKRKERPTWQPYYERVVKSKKQYSRKQKHKRWCENF